MLDAILTVLLAVLSSTPAVDDAPRLRMTAAYEKAMAHFDAGRWAKAAAELRAAYAEFPAAGLLYDEAACHERRGARARAAELYARYLKQAGAVPDRLEVQQRIAALRLGMKIAPADPKGVVLVRSNPPGALIYLGDRGADPVGATPWSGHLEGVHTLIVSGYGFTDRYEVARPRPRAVTVIDLEL
jgi:hypothetical protein